MNYNFAVNKNVKSKEAIIRKSILKNIKKNLLNIKINENKENIQFFESKTNLINTDSLSNQPIESTNELNLENFHDSSHDSLYDSLQDNLHDSSDQTKVTILIHLFHIKLFKEFLVYIKNVKTIFKNVTVIFTINIESNFETLIKKIDPRFIVLKVENKGVDVHAFLESVKFIRSQNIPTDFILKLHTKVSTNISEDLLEWRKELIRPITDLNNLIVIRNYFKKMNNIGYIGSQKCCFPKNFDMDFPQNIIGLNNLIEKFPHLEKDWSDFNAGNMFWINNDVLTKYLTNELMIYFDDKFCKKKPPNNLTDKGIFVEYLCERLFTGVFCYNSTNILVNNYHGNHQGYHRPQIFSLHTPKMV
jgi:hypothetical protein